MDFDRKRFVAWKNRFLVRTGYSAEEIKSIQPEKIVIENEGRFTNRQEGDNPGAEFVPVQGARVIEAGDPTTALRAIQQCHPNVVLSDIGLPQRNGFELLKEIRLLDSADRQVPVIAMTALGGIVERQRAIAAGFEELLRKPFGPAKLLRALQSVLR